MPYHGYAGKEIEDAEWDEMRRQRGERMMDTDAPPTLEALQEALAALSRRLDAVDAWIERHDLTHEREGERLDGLETRISDRFDDLETRLSDRIERITQRLEGAVAGVRRQVENVEHDAWRARQGR